MDNKTARQDLETVIRVEDLALGSMRKLRRIQDWLRAQPEDMVPMPQNKDQARAMALTGMKWLEDNALEQLVHVGGVEPVITNEMKAECMGEFEFTIEESCSACYFDEPQDDCEVCQGSIHYDRKVSVPWTTCKEIYKRMTKASTGTTYQEKENIGTIGHIDYRRVASRAIADIATVTELLGVPEEEAGRPIVELVQEFLAAQSKDIEALRTILVDSVRLREPDFIIGDPNDPYLIRYWLRRDRPEGSIYLHCIRKSDDDRALHDHPWSSTSLVLEGTLREILPEGSRLLTPGTIVSRSAEQAHRLEVVDGPVWTLFITGAVEREWGFHCPNGWVHWKEFTDPATNGQQIGKGCGNE